MPSNTAYQDEFDFNDPVDLVREASGGSNNEQLDDAQTAEMSSKLKRTACVLCRKRKLRCDAARPKCATCDRLGHECEYNEIRKKSGPKRGYVKALEARLSQVETQLKSANGADEPSSANDTTTRPSAAAFQEDFPQSQSPGLSAGLGNDGNPFDTRGTQFTNTPSLAPNMEASWDMISLGLEEPLPTLEIQKELFSIYFRKIAPTSPMIHPGRFYASLNYAPHMRPPVCLRYAMWTLAASASDAYSDMQLHFYRRAKKYVELDEMKSYGEHAMTLSHCQTSVLLGIFEFKNMHFPRAWLSTGRGVRLSLMLGLQRLDGAGLEVKQCSQPPADWTEAEERRRTFWMVFWEDRCASIGTGWPMALDERDIMTKLPSSEQAFLSGREEQSITLEQALKGRISNISPFASATMLTALFGRNLLHLHRPTADERESDLNGAFWQRHRDIDATLLGISLNLPQHLRIPNGLPDPNVIFMNMCIHTSVICLHQAAIFKIDRNKLPANLGQESKIRCVSAAAEIASLMRAISHCDLGTLNPFSAFCLYVASRVFVQYLKSRRNDTQILGSLHFMLSAMHALKRKTPLAESFLAQLDMDLEGAGIPTGFASSVEALKQKGFPNLSAKEKMRGSYGMIPCDGASAENPMNASGAQFGTNAKSPREELRTTGNRLAPFNEDITQWKKSKDPTVEPATIGDYSWTAQMNDRSVGSSSRQNSLPEGRVNGGRITTLSPAGSTPECAPYRVEKSWEYDWNMNSNTNNQQDSGDNMDLSPNFTANGSSPGDQTQTSGSTGQTAYTPPESDISNDLSQQQQQQSQQQQRSSLNQGYNTNFSGFDDDQPAGFINFKDFPPAAAQMPAYQVNGTTAAPSPFTQEFEDLTRQFLPQTPGGHLEAWGNNISTGLTPGPGDDWNSMLEDIGSWDTAAQQPGQAPFQMS